MQRKYYVIEGPEAEALCAQILQERERFVGAVRALMNKYQVTTFIRNSTTIDAIGLTEPGPRPGLKVDAHPTGGVYRAKPDLRTKFGKQLAQEIKDANAKEHPSDTILNHYQAARWQPVDDPRSRTGMSVAVSVGHILPCGKRITLDMPDVASEPFIMPSGAREIKKSEYIALTEEQQSPQME
jgi:hypothetical protein